MPLQWRLNVLELLKASGYSTYRIRKEKLISESSLQNFRQGIPPSWQDLETICRLTGKQPGKLIEYIPDKKNNANDQ